MKRFEFKIKCRNCGHSAPVKDWKDLDCCPKCANQAWFTKEHAFRCMGCHVIIGHKDDAHLTEKGRCRRCGSNNSMSSDSLWLLDKLFLLLTFQRPKVATVDFDYRDMKR